MKIKEEDKTKTTEKRIWLPVVIAFVFLCVIVWLDEIIDLPVLLGGPKTSPNWLEAIEETLVIIVVGFFALFKLIRSINERRRAEEELKLHKEHLEEMVDQRTSELKHMVEAMSLRVVKVSDLEIAVEQLRDQLKDAGIEPVVDIPLIAGKNLRQGG
ncbi:MAG TPA: hypothetical protein ENH12_00860 [Proteobacteria bacterium]|nr:hypothetical protein [Pseudomonadota bacterium]